MARNTVAEIPSATVNSPRSFGRVKLLSNDDENILYTFYMQRSQNAISIIA